MNAIKTIAEVMEFNSDLLPPDGLSERAMQAWACVTDFVAKHDLTYTGGCKAFHNPASWDGDYGKDSVLVVVYDGGSVGSAFDFDREDYATIEAMQSELAKLGLFSEQCTSWYSAIYEMSVVPPQLG